jgi:hypothetical protein
LGNLLHTMRNSNLKKLLEILLVLELFLDFAFIKIVCVLYVIHCFCM